MSAIFDNFAYNKEAAIPSIENLLSSTAMPPASTYWQTSWTFHICWLILALSAANAVAQASACAGPSPKLSPEDVIKLQIQALSAKGPQKTRIERCYQFASPANRLSTGPLDRFAGMINLPQYAVLLDAQHFLVGRAIQNGGQAHLLLTTVDANGNLALFRCLLSKQTAAPYVDCWMTDTVVRIGEADPAKGPQDRPVQPPSTI